MEKNRGYSWAAATKMGPFEEATLVEVAKPPKRMTPGRGRRWAARTVLRLMREAPLERDREWSKACAEIRSCNSRGTRLARAIAYDEPSGGVRLTGAMCGGLVQPRLVLLPVQITPSAPTEESATPPLPDQANPPKEGP